MWSFLVDLIRNADTTQTVVLMDTEEPGAGRQYQIRPLRMGVAWGGTLLGAGLVMVAVVAFTPLRTLIPGYASERVRKTAQVNAKRVQSLEDTIAAQRRYVARLRRLITGKIDSMAQPGSPSPGSSPMLGGRRLQGREGGEENDPSRFGQDRRQQGAQTSSHQSGTNSSGRERTTLALSIPIHPPVSNGFPTRGFNAEESHYGIDVAVSEGSYVRAIEEGSVVLADWTRDGGFTVAVQHNDGYLSVYKHNKRLLKERGEPVQAQEPLAVSGNTGEMTTGPHLHFELWRNGLAQDPQSYIADW